MSAHPAGPAPATVPPALAADLAAAGVPVRADSAAVLAGPLLSRWSLTTVAGGHLWADVPAERTTPAAVAEAPPQDPAVRIGAPIPLPSGAVAYEVPWRPALLAATITAGAPRHPAGPELGAGLGRALRTLHDGPGTVPAAEPAALARIDATGTLARTDDRLAAALAGVRAGWHAQPPAPLHGEPSTGHLLVAQRPAANDAVLAVVTGWTGRARGPAWFDAGYLIGDLLEIAHLLPADGHRAPSGPAGAAVHGSPGGRDPWTRAALTGLAAAVRRGYDDDRPRPAAFWRAATDAAAVKVLDHEARVVASFGARPEATAVMAGLGHAVLDAAAALTGS
ncbi:hypothetical protein [Jiangella alba]|uniref:Aminoglycoside phosphotransferase domain-containing protein n=1 Tax=Jiangella alba TaxID=561176 RepID=A0A1H5GWC5_9ACTN|nr:hypothetical protein [Jiangella alba]SEE19338.1 hypothetical protein SAMN04488561_0661 [Jiangella alba]